jgi:hypothetical protein
VRGIAAVLMTLVAATLAATAEHGDSYAATATAGNPAATPHRTTLHVQVAGCDRCRITLQHAVTRARSVWTSRQQKVGGDGEAVFHLRTANTHGLSFVVWAPWAGNIDAATNFVTRDAGTVVGSRQTRSQAHTAKHAEGCWAGTSSSDATVRFRVVRVPARSVTGQRTHIALGFATHALPSWKPMAKTWHGTLGNQDAFYCTRPTAH